VTKPIQNGIWRSRPSETWLQAALRFAKPYGLEAEVRASYLKARKAGMNRGSAALQACMDWDVAILNTKDNKR
jgi:hypothetical protein